MDEDFESGAIEDEEYVDFHDNFDDLMIIS